MNKQRVHQYVMEHIAGSIEARQKTKTLLWSSFVLSLTTALAIFISDVSNSTTLGIAIGVLIVGIPLGVAAQQITLTFALSRDSLRLKRFLIGKKGYVAPKSHVLHEGADLFAIASGLVCNEPLLVAQNSAAGWHSYGILTDTPDVAACTGWYGKDNKPVVFLFGDHESILELTEDIWDLGHVRKLAKGDTERYEQTIAGWKRQQLLPVALACAPLTGNIDPANLSAQDVRKQCMLLGAVGLEGSRGFGQNIPLSPAVSVMKAIHTQVVLSCALTLYAGLSVFVAKFLDKTPGVSAAQLLVFGLFVSPLLLAIFSWDKAQNPKPKKQTTTFTSLLWSSAFIAIMSLGTSLIYEYSQNLTTVRSLIIHQSAAAVGFLTLGICFLAYVVLSRRSPGNKKKPEQFNPLFVLAATSSLLMVLIVAYATGPLLIGGTLLAIGAGLIFATVHEIRAYANRHHTRDNIT